MTHVVARSDRPAASIYAMVKCRESPFRRHPSRGLAVKPSEGVIVRHLVSIFTIVKMSF